MTDEDDSRHGGAAHGGAEAAEPSVGVLGLVRFLGELAMLAALAVGGAHLGGGSWLSWLLAVALPVVAAVVWGAYVGPRAPRRLTDPAQLGVEVVLFTAAAGGLVLAGHLLWAVLLVALYLAGTAHGRRGG